MNKRGPYRKRNRCCSINILEKGFKFDIKSNCLSPQSLVRPVPQDVLRFTGGPGYMNVYLNFLKNNFSVEIEPTAVEKKRDLHKNATRLRLEKVACRDRTYNTIKVVMITDGDGVMCNIINPGITSTGVKTISECLGEGLSPFHRQEFEDKNLSEESFECKTVVLEDCKSDEESDQFESLLGKIKAEDNLMPFRGFAPKMFPEVSLIESIIARLQTESVTTPRPTKSEVFDI